MRNNLTIARAYCIRPLLTAALGLAFIFTLSCGEHSLEEIFGLDSSSSTGEEELLSSSSSKVSSSSQRRSSSSNGNNSSEEDEDLFGSSSSEEEEEIGPLYSSSSEGEEYYYPSSSSSRSGSSSSFIEYLGGSCDIADYGTVKIGNQIWMAENWGCYAPGSKCFNNDPANCAKYGRLYDWATAMDVCPPNWHIPSAAEWSTLINYVESNSGCRDCAGKHLKSLSGWKENGNGTDNFGFSALPGGYGGSSGNFYGIGENGHWWSPNASSDLHAYIEIMFYNYEAAYWRDYSKSNLFSVRCIQD